MEHHWKKPPGHVGTRICVAGLSVNKYAMLYGMHYGVEYSISVDWETGYAGSSPHVARCFFSMMFHDKNIAIYIINSVLWILYR